ATPPLSWQQRTGGKTPRTTGSLVRLTVAVAFLAACSWSDAVADPPGAKKADPPSPYDNLLTADQAIRLFEARVKGDPSDVQNQTMLVQLHLRKAQETGDFSCYE